jgi:hypothetical protein
LYKQSAQHQKFFRSLCHLRHQVKHQRDDRVDSDQLHALDSPSPQTSAPINTPIKSDPISARLKANSKGCGAMK